VFDFYEGASTPNQSTLNLAALERQRMIENTPVERNGDRSVWFRGEVIEEEIEINGALVQYGSGPVPTGAYRTPAPKDERERRKIRDREPTTQEKKDKKRKRLHVDTSSAERSRSREADEVMTDAPPVLHSGLTGGLNRLLAPGAFPPSPEFSGDRDEASPASPLKKPKHSKRGRERQRDTIGNGIMSALMGTRKSKKATEGDRVRKHKRRLREGSERPEGQKMIEYKPMNGESGNGENQQMVVYGASTRAQLFMSFINKGPESEKGCSMNKTLKRYHRERTAVGMSKPKSLEEKELWRCLRLKKNDRGEIVLFCAET
jgi:cell growth-regulating nucleolar protein